MWQLLLKTWSDMNTLARIYKPCCLLQRWLMSMRWEVKLVISGDDEEKAERVKSCVKENRNGGRNCQVKLELWGCDYAERTEIMALPSSNTLIACLSPPCQTDCFIKPLCLVWYPIWSEANPWRSQKKNTIQAVRKISVGVKVLQFLAMYS